MLRASMMSWRRWPPGVSAAEPRSGRLASVHHCGIIWLERDTRFPRAPIGVSQLRTWWGDEMLRKVAGLQRRATPRRPRPL